MNNDELKKQYDDLKKMYDDLKNKKVDAESSEALKKENEELKQNNDQLKKDIEELTNFSRQVMMDFSSKSLDPEIDKNKTEDEINLETANEHLKNYFDSFNKNGG